jgi:hypothetical protein
VATRTSLTNGSRQARPSNLQRPLRRSEGTQATMRSIHEAMKNDI